MQKRPYDKPVYKTNNLEKQSNKCRTNFTEWNILDLAILHAMNE